MRSWSVFRAGEKLCIQNTTGSQVYSYPVNGTSFSINAQNFSVSCANAPLSIGFDDIQETSDGMGGSIAPSEFAADLRISAFVEQSFGVEIPNDFDLYTLLSQNPSQEYMLGHFGNSSSMNDIFISELSLSGTSENNADVLIRVWQNRTVEVPIIPPYPSYFTNCVIKPNYTSMVYAAPTRNGLSDPIKTSPTGQDILLGSFRMKDSDKFNEAVRNITIPKNTNAGNLLISAVNLSGQNARITMSVNFRELKQMT